MSQNKTYNRLQVGKHMFPIKNGLEQGDALLPLLLNFAVEYAIRRVQVNRDDLKLTIRHRASSV